MFHSKKTLFISSILMSGFALADGGPVGHPSLTLRPYKVSCTGISENGVRNYKFKLYKNQKGKKLQLGSADVEGAVTIGAQRGGGAPELMVRLIVKKDGNVAQEIWSVGHPTDSVNVNLMQRNESGDNSGVFSLECQEDQE